MRRCIEQKDGVRPCGVVGCYKIFITPPTIALQLYTAVRRVAAGGLQRRRASRPDHAAADERELVALPGPVFSTCVIKRGLVTFCARK